ncbi:hypothetical protein ZIOFF_055330 [Zingiber officinale]|uniref:Mitochondrial protein n=1 Tax=Zingiber officinale TaxID=94328 RepID=A0A8J5FFH4_ZINOF|nr:hypothetical protein ZIOFF_055330 [Zingiber officinale]
MTDIGLMAYYLGIEVNQREDGNFISQAGYAREILKKFKMDNIKSMNTPVECGVKLSKHDEEEKVDPTFFKSLIGSLRYLTCTRPDILYAVGLVSRYMEDPTTTHLKIAKRILRYIKGTIYFGLLYSTSNHFKLEGYSDSDWGGDIDDRKSTTGFCLTLRPYANLRNSPSETAAEYSRAGVAVYRLRSYKVLLSDASRSLVSALDDGDK